MSEAEFGPEYDRAVGLLARALGAREDYAIVGGLAVPVRSVPRLTLDVDVMLGVPRIHLPRILESLQEGGFTFDLLAVLTRLRDEHLAKIHYADVPVDLMDALLPAYREVIRLASWEDLHGHRMRVASAEGLVFLKLVAFREVDRVDLRSLLAANRGKLNFDIIRDLYTQVGEVGDERWQCLERVRAELDAADREA